MSALEREERCGPADSTPGARDERPECCPSTTCVRSYDAVVDRDEGAVLLDLEKRVVGVIDDAETLDLLCRLVEAPSANPPGNEGDAAGVLARVLERGGIEARLEDVHPGRPNLTAELGPAGGPTLLLNGHTDTMPPGEGWATDPFEAVVCDGKLFGLGACDMKAGVAAMTEAVLAVKRAAVELHGRTASTPSSTRRRQAGTKHTVARWRRADFAIIAEPTELEVIRLGNGQVNFHVRFYGRAGHGSTPEAGRNAIYDAAAFVALVEAEAMRLARAPHPLIGPASYNIGRIWGGLQTSIIPSECHVGVDRRIVPGQSVHDAIADLDALLERLAIERPGCRAERTIDIEYEPFEVPEDLPGCQALRRAAAEVSGRAIGFSVCARQRMPYT